MDSRLEAYIQDIFSKDRFLTGEPMKGHTTFRVGGPADVLLCVDSVEKLSGLIHILKQTQSPYMILGNGSNILVSDRGYRGLMIRLTGEFDSITIRGNELEAGAGALLSKVSGQAALAGLTGLEFAGGIPGSPGGAVIMNAGAYGGEMKMVITGVRLMDESGNVFTKSCDEMEFGYRTSLAKKEGLIVLGATMQLESANEKDIRDTMNDLAAKRKEKQPLEYPSAGSTFKRPEGYFAGKLIQDAGLSGYRVGGAMVSTKHCGFVINAGDASASDIYALMQVVEAKVQETFGVTLEPEVILIGDFNS